MVHTLNRKCIATSDNSKSTAAEKTSAIVGTSKPEMAPVTETAGQSRGNREPPLDLGTLRQKLDKAILDEAWEAVKAINKRIAEMERAETIDLGAERRARGLR